MQRSAAPRALAPRPRSRRGAPKHAESQARPNGHAHAPRTVRDNRTMHTRRLYFVLCKGQALCGQPRCQAQGRPRQQAAAGARSQLVRTPTTRRAQVRASEVAPGAHQADALGACVGGCARGTASGAQGPLRSCGQAPNSPSSHALPSMAASHSHMFGQAWKPLCSVWCMVSAAALASRRMVCARTRLRRMRMRGGVSGCALAACRASLACPWGHSETAVARVSDGCQTGAVAIMQLGCALMQHTSTAH